MKKVFIIIIFSFSSFYLPGYYKSDTKSNYIEKSKYASSIIKLTNNTPYVIKTFDLVGVSTWFSVSYNINLLPGDYIDLNFGGLVDNVSVTIGYPIIPYFDTEIEVTGIYSGVHVITTSPFQYPNVNFYFYSLTNIVVDDF